MTEEVKLIEEAVKEAAEFETMFKEMENNAVTLADRVIGWKYTADDRVIE